MEDAKLRMYKRFQERFVSTYESGYELAVSRVP